MKNRGIPADVARKHVSDVESMRDVGAGAENGAKKRRAFTLVELIVVITILAVLATVGFLSLSGYSDDARSATVASNVRTVYSAILTESTTSGNSPRWYVEHDAAAALTGGAVAFVDGNPVTLTGGDFGVSGTNYSAGNPRWDRLRMNGDKFKLAGIGNCGTAGTPASGSCAGAKSPEGAGSGPFPGFPLPEAFMPDAGAAYSTGVISIGAFDAVGKATLNGKSKSVSYFQVVGVSPSTKKASVTGNYMAAGTWAVLGLVDDPTSASSTGAIVDSATVSVPAGPTSASCSGLPANAAYYGGAGTYSVPTGTSTGATYSATPAVNTCQFKCNANYYYDLSGNCSAASNYDWANYYIATVTNAPSFTTAFNACRSKRSDGYIAGIGGRATNGSIGGSYSYVKPASQLWSTSCHTSITSQTNGLWAQFGINQATSSIYTVCCDDVWCCGAGSGQWAGSLYQGNGSASVPYGCTSVWTSASPSWSTTNTYVLCTY